MCRHRRAKSSKINNMKTANIRLQTEVEQCYLSYTRLCRLTVRFRFDLSDAFPPSGNREHLLRFRPEIIKMIRRRTSDSPDNMTCRRVYVTASWWNRKTIRENITTVLSAICTMNPISSRVRSSRTIKIEKISRNKLLVFPPVVPRRLWDRITRIE